MFRERRFVSEFGEKRMSDLKLVACVEQQDVGTQFPEGQKLPGATFDSDVERLLIQIDEGLREDDATNREKLELARKYGPLLLRLKEVVQHGMFQKTLKTRYPKLRYSKLNRWMFIARHETQVEAALALHPDVAWGPKKMIDYLKGTWHKNIDCDEDDHFGDAPEESPESTSVNDPPESTADETGADELCDDFPNTKRWDDLVSKAESKAQQAGRPTAVDLPEVPEATVTVTVSSDADRTNIEACLNEWSPKAVMTLGMKGKSTLTLTVSPELVPDVLFRLAETLKKSLPNSLNVSVAI
jgi:hypothetical protein